MEDFSLFWRVFAHQLRTTIQIEKVRGLRMDLHSRNLILQA